VGGATAGGGVALVLCDEQSIIEEDCRALDEYGVLGSRDPASQGGPEEFRTEGSALTAKQAVEYAIRVRA